MQDQKMTAEKSTNLLNNNEVDHLVGKHEENTFQKQQQQEEMPQETNDQRVSTINSRRTSQRLRTMTTSTVVKKEPKTIASLRWQDHNISAMLAWICKNKEEWLENRSKAVRYIYCHIIGKAHSVKATNLKIYTLQHIFESCFEFVSYIYNDQASEPMRRVIRERAIKFEFYKECRAAFGPPEYNHKKINHVRNIYGPPPSSSPIQYQSSQVSSSPSPQREACQEPKQQQEQTKGQSSTPVKKALEYYSKRTLAFGQPFVTITLPKPDYIINARRSRSESRRLPFKETTSRDLLTSSETEEQMDEDDRVPMEEKHVLKTRQQKPVVVQETIMDVDQGSKTDNNNNATMAATIFKLGNEDDTKDKTKNKNVDEKKTLVQIAHEQMLDKTYEQERQLQAKEYLLMIQSIDIKMKRADLRFNKKKTRHEIQQAQRLQRMNKYKKALRTLLNTPSHLA